MDTHRPDRYRVCVYAIYIKKINILIENIVYISLN